MRIINIGILAHVDAGKTTLTEAMLHTTGTLRALGRVDDGTALTDSMSVERERGITVRAATVSFSIQGVKTNLLDTPGHVDFIAEVERSLRMLDAAVLVISCREGVQAQTRKLFSALRELHIPTIIFINKLDRAGADVERVYAQISESLTADCVPMQRVERTGEKHVSISAIPLEAHQELLIERDEPLFEAYVNERPSPGNCLKARCSGL